MYRNPYAPQVYQMRTVNPPGRGGGGRGGGGHHGGRGGIRRVVIGGWPSWYGYGYPYGYGYGYPYGYNVPAYQERIVCERIAGTRECPDGTVVQTNADGSKTCCPQAAQNYNYGYPYGYGYGYGYPRRWGW